MEEGDNLQTGGAVDDVNTPTQPAVVLSLSTHSCGHLAVLAVLDAASQDQRDRLISQLEDKEVRAENIKTFKEFILVLIFIYLYFSLKCEVKIVSQLVMEPSLSSLVISMLNMWYSINQVIVVLQISQ